MKVELPKAFQELLTAKARYKLFYGGRAGGKSFAFADALLTLATSRPLLIACVREVQNSIKDSVYKLIADRIVYYRLNEYRLYDERIVNLNNFSVCFVHFINNRRSRCYKRKPIFSFQPFLNNFHMQHS